MVRTFISAEVFLFRSPAGTSPTLLLEDLQQVWACKSQMGFLGCRCGTATRSPLPPWPDRSVSLHSQKCSSSFFSAYYSSLWGQYLKQRIHATLMWYFQIPKCLWGWIPKRYAVLPLKDMLFSSPLVLPMWLSLEMWSFQCNREGDIRMGSSPLSPEKSSAIKSDVARSEECQGLTVGLRSWKVGPVRILPRTVRGCLALLTLWCWTSGVHIVRHEVLAV